MRDTLQECEQEVQQARSKLSRDLATLRAPATFASFTDDLKRDALETKDALIDQARNSAQSKLMEFVDDLKAKAAANPMATLAIGAGIAWQLIRRPPIATALVGAGLYSLLRTNGFHPPGRSNAEYMQEGKERLKQQAGDLADSAKHVAADLGQKVSVKSAEMIETAKSKAQEWSGAAQSKAQEWSDDLGRSATAVGSALKAEVQSLNSVASDAVQNVSDKARGATVEASARTAKFVREAMHDGRDTLTQPESRDKLLLGVAGVAVATALGIACQKRIAEQVD
jgi:hypothetical protein